MIKLFMSPTGIHGSCHAPDAIAAKRGRSLSRRGDSLQGAAPVTGGQPCACAVEPGPRHPGIPDHGCAGDWPHSGVAHACCVPARGRGSSAFRRGALGAPSPVRHGRTGARHRFGVLHSTSWTAALDDGRIGACRPPRARSGWCEQRDGATHAKKTTSNPGAG